MMRVSWPAALSAPESCATPMLSPSGQSKFGQMNWIFMPRLLVGPVPSEDRGDRPEQDRKIDPKRLSIDVIAIVLVGLDEREVAPPPDLRDTGDTGLHVELPEVLRRVVSDVL